jgi:alpha,alpha-trehalase
LLTFDYDGTLAPIVSRPEFATINANVRKALFSLSKSAKFKVGIISGRRLNKIKSLVRIKNIYYVGNHGFEIEGPNLDFIHPVCFYSRQFIGKIKQELKTKLSKIKGVIIEDKYFTLSLHFRLVNSRDVNKVKIIFRQATSPYIRNKKIRVIQGKKVFEIRPYVDWNKGKALEMIERSTKQNSRPLRIYLGDDTTDEDVFKVLNKRDISVFIGVRKKSKAQYFLADTKEVEDFLTRLNRMSQ